MDLEKYRHLYVSETQENLAKMSRLLVELEGRPDDHDAIGSLFRLAHSIKGMSGTMGYQAIFDLAHLLEDLMSRFRSQQEPVGSDAVDLLLAGVDRMAHWVGEIESGRQPVPEEALALRKRFSELEGVEMAASASVEDVAEAAGLRVSFRIVPEAVAPGARARLAMHRLAGVGTIAQSKPNQNELVDRPPEGAIELRLITSLEPHAVRQLLELVPDLDSITVEAPESGAESQTRAHKSVKAAVVRGRTARTIRVRTDWLDTLLDRTADLTILSQRLWNHNQQRPNRAMTELLVDLSRTLNALHGDAMSVRMMKLAVLTERLPRVVRDMARDAGKQASMVIRGDDQDLDRAIIEGVDAPLTHLLRNAIEHGIEPPEVRRMRGKRAVGLLELNCSRVRDEVVIELRDDGAGIDLKALVQRAMDLGLLSRSRAEAMARLNLTQLVCLPGLTARSEVGPMAGRGVGLDAVLESITALGGRLELQSEPDQGTTARLRLPRTPGISKLLLVEADGQQVGLPLGRIIDTAMLSLGDVEMGDRASVRHGEQTMRFYVLRDLLGFPKRSLPDEFPGVVFSADGSTFVVGVDRVVGQADAVLKPLGALLERVEGLLGVTIDPLGRPLFVVDVAAFAALY